MCFSPLIIFVSSSELTPRGSHLSCTERPRAGCSVQMGSHQGGKEGCNPLSHHIALDEVQDTTGLLGWKCTWLGDVDLLVNQHTGVIFLRPFFRLWIWVEGMILMSCEWNFSCIYVMCNKEGKNNEWLTVDHKGTKNTVRQWFKTEQNWVFCFLKNSAVSDLVYTSKMPQK